MHTTLDKCSNECTAFFEKYILIEGCIHIILYKSDEIQTVFPLHFYNIVRELYVYNLR